MIESSHLDVSQIVPVLQAVPYGVAALTAIFWWQFKHRCVLRYGPMINIKYPEQDYVHAW